MVAPLIAVGARAAGSVAAKNGVRNSAKITSTGRSHLPHKVETIGTQNLHTPSIHQSGPDDTEESPHIIDQAMGVKKNALAARILYWALGPLALPQMYLALAAIPSIGFELVANGTLMSFVASQSLVLAGLMYYYDIGLPEGTLFMVLSYLVIVIGWLSLVASCILFSIFHVRWSSTGQLVLLLAAFVLYATPLSNAVPWAIIWVWMVTTFTSEQN